MIPEYIIPKIKIPAISVCPIIAYSCSNSKGSNKDKTDPGIIVVPSNSDATNPSLADTAYGKTDSSNKDSSKQKH